LNTDPYPEALEPVWRESLRIQSSDVDFRKRATSESICRAFLEAAWNHAEQLGVGYGALAGQNRLWVLARLLVHFDCYPRWGETVELSTWPRGPSSVFALRDFELCNKERQLLAAGASSWLVLDGSTHRPQRLDKLAARIPAAVSRMAVGRDPRKLSNQAMNATCLTAAVRYSEIDVNCHVNSATYIRWLLDSYPAGFHQRHTLSSLEVNYVGETHWSDSISILSHECSATAFAHSIVTASGREVCRAALEWVVEPAASQLSTTTASTPT
jgi:acyl-ACP thioesterase